jgi:hypothetical protein
MISPVTLSALNKCDKIAKVTIRKNMIKEVYIVRRIAGFFIKRIRTPELKAVIADKKAI